MGTKDDDEAVGDIEEEQVDEDKSHADLDEGVFVDDVQAPAPARPRKAPSHGPINAAEPERMQKLLSAKLAEFDVAKEKSATSSKSISPTAEIPQQKQSQSPEGPQPGNKRKLSEPDALIKEITAQGATDSAPAAVLPTAKSKKTRRRLSAAKAAHPLQGNKRDKIMIPPHIKELMESLNTFGQPFEEVLNGTIRHACRNPKEQHGGEAIIGNLLALQADWKAVHRNHMHATMSFLERHGVVPIGGVEIPSGTLSVVMPEEQVVDLEAKVKAEPMED